MSANGIGGLFFRADNPDALVEWYRTHLGIAADGGYLWQQQTGPTVFMPFRRDSHYLPADRQWMINFRVKDLDALVAELHDAGIAVTTNPEWNSPETGRFARIHDPEGNPVELWEPPSD